MAHFYGTIQGNKEEATRCGTKGSGLMTYIASGSGAVLCCAYVNDAGLDCVTVELVPWHGHGNSIMLYDGELSGETLKLMEATTRQ